VNGPRIDRYCRGARVDGASRAHLFAAVCDAVAHAHAAGVCHGRLGPDMVVVQSGKDGAATPIVIGYRASCDPLRAAGADLVGLEAIARAIGWSAEPGPGLTSIDALRNAVCEALSRARFV
jgi:hypothetical protein